MLLSEGCILIQAHPRMAKFGEQDMVSAEGIAAKQFV